MAGTFPDAWLETALVTVQKKGQSAQQFAAITETIDIGEGDWSGESINNCAGGRLWKQTPKEVGEITLELYPINLNYLAGGVISSINGDGTDITLSTAAAHGLQIGDTVRISNSTNYGSTDTPVNYTVATVTDSDTVTMKSTTSAAEETDGTWVGYKGNTGLFQQFTGALKSIAMTEITYDTDAVKITATAHGLAVGDIIEVDGTTNFDGPYVVEEITSADIIRATDEEHSGDGTESTTGRVSKISDGSQPLATDTSPGIDRSRSEYIVVIMWTEDGAIYSAMDATTATDKTALRFYAKDCRITSHKASFTDQILKVTVTFRYPAFNKAGTGKSDAWESTDDTDTSSLPKLTYT